jgi:two-component system chemotaxis response regulator CheB
LHAAVLVAVHTGEGSTLLSLLRMRCHLDVSLAETGGVIQRGIVYVAPPLLHLIVNANRTFTVIDKGRLQFARPSADWLFDTIAASYSEYATGIVLSGYRRDGARGITRIRETGGATIVQDPDTCEAKGMPNAAIGTGSVSLVLRPELIAHAIVDRVQAIDVDRNDRDFQNPFAAMA